MTWFIFALGAGLVSAVNVAASKFLVRDLSPILVGGSVHLLGGVLVCLAIPFSTPTLTLTVHTMLGLAAMTVVYTLGNALYFLALKDVQLSEIDLFLRSSSLWTLLGGVLLLAEPLSVTGGVGAALILTSITVLSERPHRLTFSAPQRLALGAALSFGAGNVLDKTLSASFDPLSYTALNLLLTGVGMLALVRPPPRALMQPGLWRPGAWLVAATFALTQLLLILAFQAGGSAGQVILVAQVRLVVLVAVGFGLLGERDRVGRKALATGLMLAGVYSLARVPDI